MIFGVTVTRQEEEERGIRIDSQDEVHCISGARCDVRWVVRKLATSSDFDIV